MTKFIRLPDDFDFTNLPFLCSESHRTKPMKFGRPNDKTRPYIRVTSGDYGIASKEDGKILNALRDEINRRQISGCVIRLSADDLLLAAGFSSSDEDWKKLQEALRRLQSTSVIKKVSKGEETVCTGTKYFGSYCIYSEDELEGFSHISIEIEITSWLHEIFIEPKRSFDVERSQLVSGAVASFRRLLAARLWPVSEGCGIAPESILSGARALRCAMANKCALRPARALTGRLRGLFGTRQQ